MNLNLNQMNGDQLAEALCLIAEPVERITQDDEVNDAFRKMAEDQKNNAIMIRLVGGAYARLVPLLLRKHKQDTFTILSVLTGKTYEEIATENAFQLMRDIRETMNKKVLNFFASSVGMEQPE